jgi:broad specificity phosphatase PhoE
MQTILVRHGSKVRDFSNNSSKELFSPLSDHGKIEAKETGVFLSEKKIDRIYASPLPRTYDTANLIAQNLSRSCVHFDSRLKEQLVTNVDYERKEFDSIIKKRNQNFSWSLSGCESVSTVINRFESFMNELTRNNDLETVLIVSHASIMEYWLCEKIGIDTNLAPCSITTILWKNNQWQCLVSNYTDHLRYSV